MKDSYYLDARFAETYDDEVRLQDDIPFYVELAREAAAAGQRVLELACGTGRVTIPIARTGVSVVGLDRSPAMLEVARRKPGAEQVRWTEGDMSNFALGELFGLVIIPCRSFLLLLTVAEQKACLARVHEHLVAGGRLALNFFNPDLALMAAWNTTKRGLWQAELGRAGSQQWLTREYRTSTQEIAELRLEDELGDKGALIARVYRDLRLRYVFRYEMEHLLALSGFEVEALYGWFDRRAFQDDSSEMVWLARKC